MRAVAVVGLMLVGCAPVPEYRAQPSPRLLTLLPVVAEYSLLTSAEGNACDPIGNHSNKSRDLVAAGEGHLFEQAKIDAISKAEADGIIVSYAQGYVLNDTHCVKVVGRPYRIRSLRSAQPPAPVPSTDEDASK
jgi:hypothetical protein